MWVVHRTSTAAVPSNATVCTSLATFASATACASAIVTTSSFAAPVPSESGSGASTSAAARLGHSYRRVLLTDERPLRRRHHHGRAVRAGGEGPRQSGHGGGIHRLPPLHAAGLLLPGGRRPCSRLWLGCQRGGRTSPIGQCRQPRLMLAHEPMHLYESAAAAALVAATAAIAALASTRAALAAPAASEPGRALTSPKTSRHSPRHHR